MNRKMKGGLSAIMAVLMMVLSLSGSMPVLAEEGAEVFPDDSIVYLPEDELGIGEEVEGEQTIVDEQGFVTGDPVEAGPGTASSFQEGEEVEILGDNQEEVNPEGYMSGTLGSNDSLGMGDDIAAAATPSLSFSSSSVSVKKGDTTTVTMTASGFSGQVFLAYGTNNTTSYTCTWGSSNGNTIPLRIKGNSVGSGTITVYMISVSSAMIMTSKQLTIKVISPDNPKLTVSSSSLSLQVGKSQKVNVTASGYSSSYYFQYDISNGSVVSCTWGSFSGSTCPITIRAMDVGKSTVTIYMKSAVSGSVLATAKISVNTYRNETPKVTLSPTSTTVDVGKSVYIKATVSGMSGSYYLSYKTTSTSAYRCTWDSRWSGSSIGMTVSGLNQGSGTVTVSLKDLQGATHATAQVSITVRKQGSTPSISVSPSSLSLSPGSSKTVTVTIKNMSESAYLQYSTTNSSAYSCGWSGGSGSSHSLKITGKSEGKGTVTVYLKRNSNNSVIVKASISVEVVKNKRDIKDIAFGFHNYSESISLDVCKYMFGDTQKAKYIYYDNLNNGGLCFGMACGAALLDDKSHSPYVSTFNSGKTNTRDLLKTDYSSSLRLTVSDFIKATFITQYSDRMTWVSNQLDKMVSTCKKELDAGKLVGIGIFGYLYGRQAGHEVLAYGYNQVSNTQFDLLIYDSNYVTSPSSMQSTRMTFKKSSSGGSYTSWSYPIIPGVTWGTGYAGASCDYTVYDIILDAWNYRGKLANNNRNFFSTKETSFSVLDFDHNLVARYQDGVLVEKSDDVAEVHVNNVLPDGTVGEKTNMFYAPVDLYTVVDDTPETPMDLVISDDMLSIKIETEADSFELCADDESDAVNAILTPEDGMAFAITIGSSYDDDPDEIEIDGLGTGETISIGFENGELSIVGADSASLSIKNYDGTTNIEAIAGTGGKISPEGVKEVTYGENVLYTITPDEGYAIKAVYVDGENKGAIQEYHFDNVVGPHKISAEFTCNLDACDIILSQSSYAYDGKEHKPVVSVKTPEGILLLEGVDYDVTYENNVNVGTATVYVTAIPGGHCNGTKKVTFKITSQQNGILSASVNSAGTGIDVSLSHASTVYVAGVVFDSDGAMAYVDRKKAAVGEDTVELTFGGANIKNMAGIKVMLLDTKLRPVCKSFIVK
ncbi:MAG: hypothetical protein IKE58_02545 [Blautia sp.]|nr:hypothetical protein [Blautia sp.]